MPDAVNDVPRRWTRLRPQVGGYATLCQRQAHAVLLVLLVGLWGSGACSSHAPGAMGTTHDCSARARTPFRLLVFSKTNVHAAGFRHASIEACIAAIRSLGAQGERWQTDASEEGGVFTPAVLAPYRVVVWCNTSGNALLSRPQQQAFEDFIAAGGGFVGIHAASDTYRDGAWPWYNDLVGAIVQRGPSHTAAGFPGRMRVLDPVHPALAHLGAFWDKPEEYYYWERGGGRLSTDIRPLLEVEATGPQSFDAPRPIAWSRPFGGGCSFYTALGHAASDYAADADFRAHLAGGILWAARTR